MARTFPARTARAIASALRGSKVPARSFGNFCEVLETRRLMSVNVTTYHYDNAQDGANTNETALTLSDVKTGSFGKIASLPVDGQVYAQPLVLTNVVTPSYGTRDIVFVATENDTVYAFDAYGNNPAQGYLWKTSLLQAGETAVPQSDYGTDDITNVLGITGTPVIDSNTGTLYVVGFFKESNATYSQRIYGLDVTSGANKITPVTIAASVTGTGTGSSGGTVAFNAYRENQRPALTLANGEVYVGYSSHGDEDPWHGWLLAYNASSLHLDWAYNDTPNGDAGGIWMSGGGIAVDSAGNLYFTTGNGTFDANSNGSDYSMAIEKLSPNLSVLDYFAPYNEAALSNSDLDYGCSSVILISNQAGADPNQILTESKWGTMFLNNATTGSLGEFTANGPNNDLGEGNITTNLSTSNVHQTMAAWNGHAYIGGDALTLQMFNYSGGTLSTTEVSQTAKVFGSSGTEDGQGAGVSVSSNGSSNGILWALDNSGFTSSPAVLYAYNASNLSQLLWSSNMSSGDTANNAVKFTVPVVANGYVYTAGAGSLTIYGLKAVSSNSPVLVTPASATPSTVTGTTTSLSVQASDPSPDLSPTYSWAATNVPSGATTPTFSVNGTNAANNPTVTFYKAGSYTFTATITDPNSSLTVTSSVTVTVNPTLTNISVIPSTTTVNDNSTVQLTAQANDQFGLAMSSQPTFTWSVASGGAGGSISQTGLYTAPATGTGTDIVTAASGALSASATVTVALPSATTQVDLTSVDNRVGIVLDGTTFSGGIDGNGAALSSNLIGTSATWNNSSFVIPAATAANTTNNVVYGLGQTIAVPQNKYSSIKLLGMHLNGNATGLKFIANYTDGTTQTFNQSMSDWYTPQNYTNESKAITMSYRDEAGGAEDARTFYVYGYKLTLTNTKTLASITFPSDTNMVVISMDLLGIAVVNSAAANPSTVTGTTTTLSALASVPTGDASPTYTWAATNLPSGASAPTFSSNGTNASGSTNVTFTHAGVYTFTVTITDPTTGLFTTSTTAVTVNQTVSGIGVTPAASSLLDGQSLQLTASVVDQFGNAFGTQPSITWGLSNSSVGSISSTGLYQAPYGGTGSATVQASGGGYTGTAAITVASTATASFYPSLAGWYRSGTWEGTSGLDGANQFTSPAGNTVLISKNPSSGFVRDSYLLFNISNQAFTGDTINSVTLSFNAAAVNQAGPVSFGVYNMSNTSWGATTGDPSPAPTYTGSSLVSLTQNVGGTQGVYATYNYSLASIISNKTNGLISLELNSPGTTTQETGIEIDTLLNTPGVDPVITVNYSLSRPAWLGAGSVATWNASTKVLTVTGATSIIADPGTDMPVINAVGSGAVVTINPTSTAPLVHIGGLNLSSGASVTMTSAGTRNSSNYRVLVLGAAGQSTAPTLLIDSTSKLNLTNCDLIDHGGTLASVQALLNRGANFSSGYWNGTGIDSSTAAADTLTTLAAANPYKASTIQGEAVSTSDVEVAYTYFGDSNLDGQVDGSDYSLIDNGFNNGLTGWHNGDFNGDGLIDGSDYTLIDNAFNTQGSPLATSLALIASPLATVATPAATPAVKSKPAIPTTAATGKKPITASAQPGTPGDLITITQPTEAGLTLAAMTDGSTVFATRHIALHGKNSGNAEDIFGLLNVQP